MAVAHGIYDFVDKRIQELDSQLVEFDKELVAERERLGVEPVWHATFAAELTSTSVWRLGVFSAAQIEPARDAFVT